MKNILTYIFISILIIGAFTLQNCKNETSKNNVTASSKSGDKTIDSLTALITKQPKQANLYFERAKLFFKNGEQGGYDFAIADMQNALSLDSLNVSYYHFLSDVYMKYAQPRLSIETLERATSFAPKDIPSLLKLSKIYFTLEQRTESMIVVDKILKIDPQNSDAYFLLGMNMRDEKDQNRAINAFQKAVDINSRNKDAFIELGNLWAKKNSPLAIKYFDNALLIDSLDVAALSAKGIYLHRNRKFAEAMSNYQKITQIEPNNAGAYLNLGLVYMDTNAFADAVTQFNIAIDKSPRYAKAYFYRGQCADLQRDKAKAIADYKTALQLFPNYEEAKIALGKLE